MRNLFRAAHLALVAALLCACNPVQLPSFDETSGDEQPRMGAVVSRRGDHYPVITLLDAVDAAESADSGELWTGGQGRSAWFDVVTADFAAGTNLVGTLDIRGGTTNAIADHVPLDLDVDTMQSVAGSLPTGLTIDAEGNGFTIADTLEANVTIGIPLVNLPPYLSVRFVSTSGGTSATVTVRAGIQK